MKEPRS